VKPCRVAPNLWVTEGDFTVQFRVPNPKDEKKKDHTIIITRERIEQTLKKREALDHISEGVHDIRDSPHAALINNSIELAKLLYWEYVALSNFVDYLQGQRTKLLCYDCIRDDHSEHGGEVCGEWSEFKCSCKISP
jgi:hypothetical protein